MLSILSFPPDLIAISTVQLEDLTEADLAIAIRSPLAEDIPEDAQEIPSNIKRKAVTSGPGGSKRGRGSTQSSSRFEAAKRKNIVLNVTESSSQLPVAK